MLPSPRIRTAFGLALALGLCVPLARVHADDDGDAVPGLTKALADESPLVRKRAAIALERLGPKAKEAAVALEKLLKDEDADVRAAAAAALEKIDGPKALAALVRRVGDKEVAGKERAEACKQLGENFGREPAAVRALEAALGDPVIKLDAARALEMIDTRTKRKSAPAGKQGTRVAILNMKHVVMNYKKWQRFTEGLKGEYKKYQERAAGLNREMEGLKKEMAASTDPEDKKKIEQRAKKLQQQMQQLTEEAKKALGKMEIDELVLVDKEIAQAVKAYAQENDIDLVLQYTDATNDAELFSPQNVQRKMSTGPTTPLYVKPGEVDISAAVVERLNAAYANAAPPQQAK
jgi:Skp family chaperone for outer membrane proteins